MPSIEYVNAVMGLSEEYCFGQGNPNLIEPPLSPALKISGMSEAKDKEMQDNIWNIANKRIAVDVCIMFCRANAGWGGGINELFKGGRGFSQPGQHWTNKLKLTRLTFLLESHNL